MSREHGSQNTGQIPYAAQILLLAACGAVGGVVLSRLDNILEQHPAVRRMPALNPEGEVAGEAMGLPSRKVSLGIIFGIGLGTHVLAALGNKPDFLTTIMPAYIAVNAVHTTLPAGIRQLINGGPVAPGDRAVRQPADNQRAL